MTLHFFFHFFQKRDFKVDVDLYSSKYGSQSSSTVLLFVYYCQYFSHHLGPIAHGTLPLGFPTAVEISYSRSRVSLPPGNSRCCVVSYRPVLKTAHRTGRPKSIQFWNVSPVLPKELGEALETR